MTSGAELLLIDEAAERLRTTPATIRRWIREGKLRASRPGNRILIHADSITELLEATLVQPVVKQPMARPPGAGPPAPRQSSGAPRTTYRDRVKAARAADRARTAPKR